MKNKISILFAKIIIFFGKIMKRGSVLPGSFILKFNKNIWQYFKLPNTVIAVTGSSGKGSNVKVLAKLYEDQGYKVSFNQKGSNIDLGILTLLLEETDFKGNINSDVLIMEVDERYCKHVFPHIKPNYVVVTNITRDQPPRQGNVDIVFKEIIKSLDTSMHLILNGDDPYLRNFEIKENFDITYYGINETIYSYKNNHYDSLNIVYCPKCNSKLKYHYYHFEANGDYYCDKCDFKNPKLKFTVTDLDYENYTMRINNKHLIKLADNMLYYIDNILSVFTTASLLKLDLKKVLASLNAITDNTSNHETYHYKNRLVNVFSNKAENSSTFNQSILYTNRNKKLKTIVIGWMEISRRYEFDDLSWLYDLNLESLKDDEIDSLVCMGINADDIALRFKYAGFKTSKIKTFKSVLKATEYVKNNTNGEIYALLNFDHFKPFNDYMKGVKK